MSAATLDARLTRLERAADLPIPAPKWPSAMHVHRPNTWTGTIGPFELQADFTMHPGERGSREEPPVEPWLEIHRVRHAGETFNDADWLSETAHTALYAAVLEFAGSRR